MNIAIKYRDRIDSSTFMPQVRWDQPKNERKVRSASAAAVSLSESTF
jgi:hypothetical protein